MKKSSVLLTAALMFCPTAVLAQAYTGVTAGWSDTNLPGFDDSSGWSIQAGYRFGDYFAFEGSYTDMGDWGWTAPGNVAAAIVEGYGVDLAILGIFPVTEKVEVFGRLGFAHWEADLTAGGPGGIFFDNEDGEDPTYGGGIAFNINTRWSLSLGYQLYKAEDVDIDYVYFGSKYYFGSRSRPPVATTKKSHQVEPASYQGTDGAISVSAVSEAEKTNCTFIRTITTGSGGPGDASYHADNAMNRALTQVGAAGGDSYFLVDMESTEQGASVVIEALDCN